MRFVLDYTRHNVGEGLCQIDLHNSSLTFDDMYRDFQQTSGILNSLDALGHMWTVDYYSRVVISNQAGSRVVLLQFSNERLENIRNPHQILEDTSVLKGPSLVPRWVTQGQQRVIKLTQSGAYCHVVEGMGGIEFTNVTDEMEVLFLLERYFPGADEAGWESTEPTHGLNIYIQLNRLKVD